MRKSIKKFFTNLLGIIFIGVSIFCFYCLVSFFNLIYGVFDYDYIITLLYTIGYIFGALMWMASGIILLTNKEK